MIMLALLSLILVLLLLQSQYAGSVSTTEQQPQVKIPNLDTCQNYWVTVTAIEYCGARSTSDPMFVGIKDTVPYELQLQIKDISCDDWIKLDTDTKIMDMEQQLQGAGPSCGLTIPCFITSQWKCDVGDQMKLTFL